MNRNIIFCVFFFSGFSLFSIKSFSLEQSFKVGPEARMILVLDAASVQFKGQGDASGVIHIQVTEATGQAKIDLTTEGNLIKLTQVIAKKEGQMEGVHKNSSRVEVSGASIPLELHIKDGSIFVQRWNQDITAHIGKGKILARENSGTFSAHAIKGEIIINQQNGPVNIDGVQATVLIKDGNGNIDAQTFLGDMVLEKNNGVINANTNSGHMKIMGGQGALNFETLKGTVTAQNFDGRIEGVTNEGSVTINAMKESDVFVRSNQGKVVVQTSPGSGAFLNLFSAEGDVALPPYLKPNRNNGAFKSFKGNLRGDLKKGSISVKSQSGTISIR